VSHHATQSGQKPASSWETPGWLNVTALVGPDVRYSDCGTVRVNIQDGPLFGGTLFAKDSNGTDIQQSHLCKGIGQDGPGVDGRFSGGLLKPPNQPSDSHGLHSASE